MNALTLKRIAASAPRLTSVGALIMLVAMLIACGGGGGTGDGSTVPLNTYTKLVGAWEQRGYGRALDISGNTVTSYDFTSQTCVRVDSNDLSGIIAELNTIAGDGSEFTLKSRSTGVVTRYYKLSSLPSVCGTPTTSRPTEIFNHVWHTYDEYYAFFAERNIDWMVQYDAVRDRVHDGMSEAELFSALKILIGPIDDTRVSINRQDSDSYEHARTAMTTTTTIINNDYLRGEYVETEGPTNAPFKWGLIGSDIGYLSIGSFTPMFEPDIEAHLAEVEDLMDQALSDLNGTRALIIDVRLSHGGEESITLAIAGRFADMKRVAIRKLTRTLDGERSVGETYISPTNRVSYGNPVVLLTSSLSAGAAESFALAMRSLPQVTLVGEPTNGALTNTLVKSLPNNWQFELANEVYLDADGHSYSVVGISPDVEVSAFAEQEGKTGQDSALNEALRKLVSDFTIDVKK